MTAIIGFSAGGPVSLCTVGHGASGMVTYVTCELACYDEQLPGPLGRYELLMTTDSEQLCRRVLTSIGAMSFHARFGPHHTLDLGDNADPESSVAGIVFEEFSRATFDGEPFGILRCIGVTRAELEHAISAGVPSLLRALKSAGVYPDTPLLRSPVLSPQ